ncbi:uncharacterized protein LOC131937004 [Physella acuta]|uniref:uncharacterized protein LOC131937004 n=1 Tax=Physella acuta TaxID=109671 RepID=UPI0027DD4458|nr:uncharacterized protein LOC131937004 [Physella acuta]
MDTRTAKMFLAVLLLTCVSCADALCAAYSNRTIEHEDTPNLVACYEKCAANYLCYAFVFFRHCELYIKDVAILQLDENSNPDNKVACSNRSSSSAVCGAYIKSKIINQAGTTKHMDCFEACVRTNKCSGYSYNKLDKSCKLRLFTRYPEDINTIINMASVYCNM